MILRSIINFSLLFGNLYTYFAFGGEANINKHTRITLFTVLTSLGAAGVIAMLILRSGVQSVDGSVNTAERCVLGYLLVYNAVVLAYTLSRIMVCLE